MAAENPWMAADLAMNMLLACLIVLYALWTLHLLKIRLNLITRVKWVIALVSILLRVFLTIVEFIQRTFYMTAFKYYYLFLLD